MAYRPVIISMTFYQGMLGCTIPADHGLIPGPHKPSHDTRAVCDERREVLLKICESRRLKEHVSASLIGCIIFPYFQSMSVCTVKEAVLAVVSSILGESRSASAACILSQIPCGLMKVLQPMQQSLASSGSMILTLNGQIMLQIKVAALAMPLVGHRVAVALQMIQKGLSR